MTNYQEYLTPEEVLELLNLVVQFNTDHPTVTRNHKLKTKLHMLYNKMDDQSHVAAIEILRR